MGAQLLATSAIVLNRTESGDKWMRLVCFSVEHGNLDCLVRKSQKPTSKSPTLDLFDDAHLSLESTNQGRTWFIKEATVERRRAGLGNSYEALTHACRFSRILVRNPVHDESRRAVHALLERALDAWETGTRPECVYFKSLFLLARDEGYPVQQDWWPRLESDDRQAAESILRTPVAEQEVSDATVSRLTHALEHYLHHDTEIRVIG
jgi:hypothetical protein